MQNAVAFANNDVITIAWSYGQKLDGCMGFCVSRIGADGKATPLPAMATFPQMTRKPGDTCERFPIQKFYWKDPYARLVAEKTGERKFRYQIVPLEGKPGALKPMKIPQVTTNEVEITPHLSGTLSAYFNRGLISTQRVARALAKKLSLPKTAPGSLAVDPTDAKGGLLAHIRVQDDALRASLSGDMVEALLDFVGRAKAGGKLYAALYELHDEELVELLEKSGKKVSIVLSNAMADEVRPQQPLQPKTKTAGKKVDGNMPARTRLTKTAAKIYNRLLPNNQIGHNKFVVYVDRQGKPRAVLLGSTNWTPTGLCGQTNNTIVLANADAAARYLAYWKALAADTVQAKTDPKKLQGATLRKFGGTTRKAIDLNGDGEMTNWFSPNTPKLRSSSTKTEKRPPDMADVVEAINNARDAVLFLAFYPGTPNVAQWAADAKKKNKNLFVRGCVTNPSTSQSFYYELHGVTPPAGKNGGPAKEDMSVIAAQALSAKSAPPGWLKEILKAGFAIVHDKVVVIDPFSKTRSVVITGSHNLGHKASFNNDENLVIVRGNRRLAEAYAAHVLDVYDHFAWRVSQNNPKSKGDATLSTDAGAWQNRYFNADGSIRVAQLRFWLSARAN